MNVVDVIDILESARVPERMHDGYVGSLFGWRRDVQYVSKGNNSPVKKVTWLSPSGEPGIVPSYTTSLEAALQLAETITTMDSWGASWENGRGRAVIGNGRPCEALTPAMALCIAALKIMGPSSRPAAG
jgi:hypothetical protein